MTGALEAAVVLGVFLLAEGAGLAVARNLAFSTLVFSELFRSFAARSPDRTFFSVGAFTNRSLLGVVGVSVLFQVLLQQSAWLCGLFRIAPLSPWQLAITVLAGLIPVTTLELSKFLPKSAG